MAKPFVSPLLGYNNNVRHKNRTFHIQTEDSGVKRPHIITHLFIDGGRILKSIKTSYAEHLEGEDVQEVVRTLMREQHKSMFIALKDGQFDNVFENGASDPKIPVAPAAGIPASGVPSSSGAGSADDTIRTAALSDSGGLPAMGPSPLEVNLNGVQRVRRASVPPVAKPQGDGAATAAATPSPEGTPLSRGKYAPTRPASIFGKSKPSDDRSIFGNDVAEDRSLDEVILSYLAEDLEKKK